MTAGNSFVLWKSAIWLTTCVDCASAGSHDEASLLSTSGSFDAGPNSRPSTRIQKPTTNHFVTRDDGIRARRPISPVVFSSMMGAPLLEYGRAPAARINARAAA